MTLLTDPSLTLTMGLVVLIVGGLIGSVGVGGVLLVPAFTSLAGLTVHEAVAIAMFAYIFSGIAGTVVYSLHHSFQWRAALLLCIGSLPGGFAGALLLTLLSAPVATLLIAVFIVIAGLRSLGGNRAAQNTGSENTFQIKNSTFFLLCIGFGVGCLSSLTGTGGPLVLLPLASLLAWPVRSSLGLSQVIQIPIAIAATFGNLQFGQLDFSVALPTAVLITFGAVGGAIISHRLPTRLLRIVISLLLILTGSFMIVRLL